MQVECKIMYCKDTKQLLILVFIFDSHLSVFQYFKYMFSSVAVFLREDSTICQRTSQPPEHDKPASSPSNPHLNLPLSLCSGSRPRHPILTASAVGRQVLHIGVAFGGTFLRCRLCCRGDAEMTRMLCDIIGSTAFQGCSVGTNLKYRRVLLFDISFPF